MALGAITLNDRAGDVASAPLRADIISFAGDTSYPLGGSLGLEAALAAELGVTPTILAVLPQDCGQYVPAWDFANKKLKVLDGGHATWDEVADTTPLNSTTFNVLVISI